MTTLTPRSPYTEAELAKLYPTNLQLEQVQVLLRHGERSPVNARFKNAGLAPYWPYCNHAREMRSVITAAPGTWDTMTWRRKLETFGGKDDAAGFATGPRGETNGICLPGELSDPGRATTLALGERLRHLYVDQLKFMPSILSDTKSMYLRATPIQRALESVQQTFQGMYPPSARAPGFPIPDIVTRSANDETLFPNEGACKRFAELSQAFADRTAVRWNSSSEMAYLNKLIGKWMLADSPVVAVDSHPRLSGIMDTVNSTLAHGPETRLPSEFYDTKGREIINQIGVEEWFSGYTESAEYRAVGIGGLAGDIVARMVEHARNKPSRSGESSVGNGTDLRFALSGCHDTTLAALLTSLGAFDGEPWPPYTSHIAIELFRGPNSSSSSSSPTTNTTQPSSSWYSRLFGPATSILTPSSSSRTPLKELPSSDRTALSPYYVRLRYNDKIMTVPACKVPGNHFGDDESMCTLSAFKGVVDAFTPKNWKQACRSNLGTSAFPETEQRAGGMV